ncbi:unnamed protein product [Candida verbasci]|uniref:alpha-1,2-Mannosidase n=1 Tax=Candida verbasci TaxID=1227364 RepID=A0A9W4TZU6_9ASCO|nr:unnamed protein product [Candida verbasci]
MSFNFGISNISRGNNSYKDKPTSSSLPLYYNSKNSNPFAPKHNRNKKILMLFKGFLYSILLYIVYIFISNAIDGGVSNKTNWQRAQLEVKQAMAESWHDYEKYAWGKDVYHPISKVGENMGPKPLGWMIVDSIDTLMIMNLDEEVSRAKDWIKNDLDYNFNYEVNTFETTIRMLGGLLSAYHLSKDDLYLDKAVSLANSLHGAFDSKTGIPYSSVNLATGKGIPNHVDNGASSTAEVATLQLEFKYLSKLTGELDWWRLSEKIMEVLDSNKPQDGLVPIYVNPDTGIYQGNLIRLGSRGDSYYEYLLKQYLQTNEQESIYWQMYKESVNGVKKHLLGKSEPNKLTFVGELNQGIKGELSNKMDHLVCFYGGLLALGATKGLPLKEARNSPNWNKNNEDDFELGESLTYTCYKMYNEVEKTGLSPEIVHFNTETGESNKDFIIKPLDRHNLQRPETVESLFYLYRLTGEEKYRKWGYEIFKNFIKYTKVVNKDGDVSYSSLKDVTSLNQDGTPKFKDSVESFWWAETLKYLYLLFDDSDKISLREYVFNTEAHPLPIFEMGDYFKTGWKRQPTLPSNEEPKMRQKDEKIDRNKNIPNAQPVDKSIEEEAKDILKNLPKNSKNDEDIKLEQKEKLNKILKDIENE